jgi:hypothetical protein
MEIMIFEYTWISTMSGSFHVNVSFSGLAIFEKISFKDPTLFFYYHFFCFYIFVMLIQHEQFSIFYMSGWFAPSFNEIELLVLEKIDDESVNVYCFAISPIG